MAYDIHIFRGKEWWSGTTDPITEEQLLSVEGVEKADSVVTTNPLTGASISFSHKGMFSYKGVYLILKKGIINVTVRNEETIEVIRPLASALGAVIQGDETEFY